MTTFVAAPDEPHAASAGVVDDDDEGGTTTTPTAIASSTGATITSPGIDDDDVQHHVVELVLSRGAYRCGDTVCGTVRLFLRRDGDDDDDGDGSGGAGCPSSSTPEVSAAAAAAADYDAGVDRREGAGNLEADGSDDEDGNEVSKAAENEEEEESKLLERIRRLRRRFREATVHVAGRCRLDPRWHPAIAGGGVVDTSSSGSGATAEGSIGEMYGSVHPLLAGLPDETRRVIEGGGGDAVGAVDGGGGGVTVCFFATDCVDLLDLPEREEPRELEPFRPSISRPGRRRRGGGVGDGAGDAGVAVASTATAPSGDAGEGGTDGISSASRGASPTADDGTGISPRLGVGTTPPPDSSASSEESGRGRRPRTWPRPQPRPRRRRPRRPRRDHLAFTFRAPLPADLPHTVRATCCGYHYSAVASVRTDSGEVITAQVPFTVLSCSRMTLEGGAGGPGNAPPALRRHPSSDVGNKAGARSGGRVRFGPCVATAHSRGLPCRVSATTLNRRAQIGVSSTGLCSTMTARDSRSVRVTNADGIPFCVLTLVGTEVVLPGGRVLLQFQFERELLRAGREQRLHDGIESMVNGTSPPPPPPLRCLQVCACLRGEEVACFGAARATTRTYVFDAKHALVEEDARSLAMSLLLPMDCPCSLSTDQMDVSIFCQIELTVEKAGGGHETLRLDLPCRVVHTKIYRDNDDTTNDADHNAPHYLGHIDEMGSEEGGGLTQDVLNDLTMLSLRMIEDCI